MPDLGKGTRLIRSDSAVKVGINRGFACPCATRGHDIYVLAFLSALATPIVRRFETWMPDARGATLQRHEGFCESAGALEASSLRVESGHGAIGEALATAAPAVAERLDEEPAAVAANARAACLKSMIALPLLRDGRVVTVVAWYF
jgi:hypothetical protein